MITGQFYHHNFEPHRQVVCLRQLKGSNNTGAWPCSEVRNIDSLLIILINAQGTCRKDTQTRKTKIELNSLCSNRMKHIDIIIMSYRFSSQMFDRTVEDGPFPFMVGVVRFGRHEDRIWQSVLGFLPVAPLS